MKIRLMIPGSKSSPAQAGASLVEVMIGTMIGGFVLAALAILAFYSGRSFAALTNYVELDSYSRAALDLMTKDIRQANNLVSWSDTKVEFSIPGGQLIYEYLPEKKLLLRQRTGEPDKTLLKECDFMQFSIFQRNPIGGTYDQHAVATAGTCKVVQLHWICSRQILKQKANTESVQSAKIVIRRQ